MKLFQNLFKAKWKHKDPEIRKSALLALEPETNQDIFTEIAQSDEVPEIRLLAVKRLNNLSQLQQIAQNNSDAKVKDQAYKMVSLAYTGSAESNLNVNDLNNALSQLEDQKILEHVAKQSSDIELRRIAINKINREALLGDIASNDKNPELRKLAADKIQQKSTLERVYKKTKTKDKNVSQLIKNKLDEIIRAEKEPQEKLNLQKQLCLQLENLGKKGLWERDKLQFDSLVKQWNEISDKDTDLNNRFENATTAFDQAYQTYLKRHEERLKQEEALIPVKEEKQAVISKLHELLSKLEGLAEEDSASALKQEYSIFEQQWDKIQKLPAEIEEEFHAQFKDASASISSKLKNHIQTQETIKNHSRLQADLEKLIEQPKRLTEKSLEKIKSRFNQAYSLSSSDKISKAKTKTSNLLQKAESKLNSKQDKIEGFVKKLESELVTMENKLNEGVLKEAIAARKSSNELIENLEHYGHNKLGEFKRQLNSVSVRINELANWRSWANTPQKEELCQKIEALIDSNEDPKDIAYIIKKSRDEWKKLGPSERDTSQQLWERFQAACEKAYEPCKAYFEDEAKHKQQNYEIRLAFVEDMEKFIDSADWETIDWKKVESLFRHSRNEWKNLGHTDAGQRKALNKRFYAAFAKIKDSLNVEWDKNKEAKQEIIKKAKDLEANEDLDAAISGAKTLQGEWKKAGRIPQKLERELWTEFRQSCDNIFKRRENIKEQEKQEFQKLADQKQALCDTLDTITNSPLKDILELRGQYEKNLKDIKEIGNTVKKIDQQVENRINEIQHIFERKVESANRLDSVKQLQELSNVTQLLEKLEESIEVSLSPTHINEAVEECQSALENASTLSNEWRQSIQSRLDNAINIASTQNYAETLKESIAKNFEEKQNNTILLEVIADVETPPAFSEQKLNVQTQRLNNKLKHQDEEDDWQTFLITESKWWLCGPTAIKDLQDLAKRRQIAIENLKSEYVEELKEYN